MHKFNPEKLKKLDSPERHKMMPSDELVAQLKLEQKTVIADIGCGIGYFTLPLAQKAVDGHIYALDISEVMLEEAKRKLAQKGVGNVTFLRSEENHLPLKNSQIDMAFMAMVLHEIAKPSNFLHEVNRILQRGGRLAILEWTKEAMEVGPPQKERLSSEETKAFVAAAGFHVEKLEQFKEHFYLLQAVKF